MHKRGLTQAEIGLTQPENRPNSNFRRVVACTLQESAEKTPAYIDSFMWQKFILIEETRLPI